MWLLWYPSAVVVIMLLLGFGLLILHFAENKLMMMIGDDGNFYVPACMCWMTQLHQYSLQQMQDLSRRRAAALDYHRQEYERTHPHHVEQQRQQQPRRPIYQTDSFQLRTDSDDDGEDEID